MSVLQNTMLQTACLREGLMDECVDQGCVHFTHLHHGLPVDSFSAVFAFFTHFYSLHSSPEQARLGSVNVDNQLWDHEERWLDP